MDKKAYVTNYIKSIIGDPIISAITEESSAVDNAIQLAQVEYWVSFPFVDHSSFTINYDNRSERIISIQSLKDQFFTDPLIKQKAYYLGIVRTDKKDIYEGSTLSSTLDAYLLNRPTLIDVYDLERFQLQKTKSNLLQGALEYRIDEVNQNIHFIIPYGFIQFTVFHAFGFDDPTLSYIDGSRVSLFAKMCCLRFLDMIISSRSSILLQGDAEISTNYFEKKRDELNEEVKEIIKKTLAPIIL